MLYNVRISQYLKLTLTILIFNLSFEHSLVQELGYDGYQRLRRGFNRAFGGEEKVPKFKLVVDAGCGTGLVGEQVRLITLIFAFCTCITFFGSFWHFFSKP